MASTRSAAAPEVYAEVLHFYARQMHMMDGGDFAGFAKTFMEDGVFTLAGGRGVLEGREAIGAAAEAAEARYQGGRPRHWFDMMTAEETADGTLETTYYALVSVTARDGSVRFEPSCVVRDTLVRRDGGLLMLSRTITRDDIDRPAAG
ncbi:MULTISPECIES: nuclear transport factor 2 family protein [Streptomyces]|uniref:nuclear transport factor 2 family protein n=1 Tax=Streptomyces TaxID=1883 RepID=UPI00136A4950|nr:nuclear transport factor 2 family protein [Streptomyces sp. SID2888]MYV50222.1 nuclear transport factor 2 family protein [Streptomyces sp. SID2888]